MHPQKFCYAGHKISPNYPLFLNIKLDRNITISISYATVELAKLNMRKDYASLTFSNQKSNKFAYLIKTNYVNIKYIQHMHFIKQNVPCNFNNDKMQL